MPHIAARCLSQRMSLQGLAGFSMLDGRRVQRNAKWTDRVNRPAVSQPILRRKLRGINIAAL